MSALRHGCGNQEKALLLGQPDNPVGQRSPAQGALDGGSQRRAMQSVAAPVLRNAFAPRANLAKSPSSQLCESWLATVWSVATHRRPLIPHLQPIPATAS